MVAPRGSIEFLMKMKLKPAQKDLIDRVADLSDDEIENSGQPLWIRKHLYTLRSRGGQTASDSAGNIAAQMQANHIQRPDPEFPVYEWTQSETLIRPDGRGLTYDIQEGELFLADTTACQIKIGYSVLNVNSARIHAYTASSKIVGLMTDRQYIEEVGRRKVRR